MELFNELYQLNEDLRKAELKIVEQLMLEGVDDPSILKCIFMAGGPGSGKSFVAQELFGIDKQLKSSFGSAGLKVVNSDPAFEQQLKKNGIDPKDLGRIEKEDPSLWDYITKSKGGPRDIAKQQMVMLKGFYEAGRLGMIIDGTGDDFDKIQRQKKEAENLGYDTYMVFVNTSLEVALIRNAERDRTLPEDLVTASWKECQENMGKFQSLFGSGKFTIVDNTEYKKGDYVFKHKKTGKTVAASMPLQPQVRKAIQQFIAKPIYNPIGKKWVETARKLKSANIIK
jgi:cytidylate kinase